MDGRDTDGRGPADQSGNAEKNGSGPPLYGVVLLNTIDFFTEEESAKVIVDAILPQILPKGTEWNVYSFQGKNDMLGKLPKRLRAYHHQPLSSRRVVILIDSDHQDCTELKSRLEETAKTAGLVTKTADSQSFRVVTRIVVEELEAWFFGDVEALSSAYASVPKSLSAKKGFEFPDRIHDPAEQLSHVLKKEYSGRLPKLEVAARISRHMVAERNTSLSFQAFCRGVWACAGVCVGKNGHTQ